jgi:hypothetical protein
MTYRSIAHALTATLTVVMLGACSASVSVGSTPEVSKADVESKAAAQLASTTHQAPPTITCPSGLKAKVGAAIDCTLSVTGDTATYPVHIDVESVKGTDVGFHVQVGDKPVGQ